MVLTDGRLTLPGAGTARVGPGSAPPGLVDLGRSHEGQPAYAFVPPSAYAGGGRLRLVVVLHGAGGEPRTTLGLFDDLAEEHRLLVLAPKSAGPTWDVIRGGFGPDVRHLDQLLTRVEADYSITGRTVAGFSDGASYALTLGLTNGDVFDSVIAFSPGFTAAEVHNGTPRIFLTHGTRDEVLPLHRCCRRIVPELQRAGYQVTYREFEGGHQVPPDLRAESAAWLSG